MTLGILTLDTTTLLPLFFLYLSFPLLTNAPVLTHEAILDSNLHVLHLNWICLLVEMMRAAEANMDQSQNSEISKIAWGDVLCLGDPL